MLSVYCEVFYFVGIERDAVSIFSKYLSHDASHPIGITEELRNEVMSKSALYPSDCSVKFSKLIPYSGLLV